LFFLSSRRPPSTALFPYTTLFRSVQVVLNTDRRMSMPVFEGLEYSFEFVPRPYENFEMFVNAVEHDGGLLLECHYDTNVFRRERSEEHTSELQSRENLVCRLLLEK